LQPTTFDRLQKIQEEFERLKKTNIVPWAMIYHSNAATGNWIDNCKNTFDSFNCNDVEDGRYLYGISRGKDLMDYWQWSSDSELVYEAINTGIQCGRLKFVNECWNQFFDAEYSMNCHSAQHLFGCVGIRKGEYSILNQRYTKEEYEVLVTRIKKHMDEMLYRDAAGRTYGYGEYFPIEISPFAYNETMAQEFFPITKEEAMKQGYPWREPETRNYTITLKTDALPSAADSAGAEITKPVIGCEHAGACTHQCTTAFRILPEDLRFYSMLKVPLPQLCPNCRHANRLYLRNPLNLWNQKCQCRGASVEGGTYVNTGTHFHGNESCPNEFKTSHAPNRSETVYCEQCYQAEVA